LSTVLFFKDIKMRKRKHKEIDTYDLGPESKVIVAEPEGMTVDVIIDIETISNVRIINLESGSTAYDHQVYAWTPERDEQLAKAKTSAASHT
jgi:hypothetical protein